MPEAWIIDALRSPRGRGKKDKGALSQIHPQRIMAQVLQGLEKRVGFDPGEVDDVVLGCGSGNGDHAHDIARMSALDAGWPNTATGVTLNRFCGSGQQAVSFAAMGIMAGQQDLVIGGGIESMSRPAPLHAKGFHANNDHLFAMHPMVPQGISADLIATVEGFSREDCDGYAVMSQERAAEAIGDGRFDDSIIPIHDEEGNLALERDEHPRPGTTLESLSSLPASFEKMGSAEVDGYPKTFDAVCKDVYPEIDAVRHVHHAGNSSGVVDGGGAVLLAAPDYAKAHGMKPRAKIVMTATAGTEPVIMLTAPVPAAENCLRRAGMDWKDIDLFEVNEAFASVVLKFIKDSGVGVDRLNVNGGAIALGHPIGATGAMLIGTILDELERRDLQTGLVAMCTGGGMGTATIIERV